MMKKSLSKKETTKTILLCIAGAGLVVTLLALPGLGPMLKLFSSDDEKKKWRIHRALKELERKNEVRIYKKEGLDVVEITNKGKKKVLKYKFNDITLSSEGKWDKKWRMVIFDIPQYKWKERRAIAVKLKDMDCYHYQKSVFVFPYDFIDEVDFVGSFLGVRKFLKYLVVSEIEDQEKLKAYFKLK